MDGDGDGVGVGGGGGIQRENVLRGRSGGCPERDFFCWGGGGGPVPGGGEPSRG